MSANFAKTCLQAQSWSWTPTNTTNTTERPATLSVMQILVETAVLSAVPGLAFLLSSYSNKQLPGLCPPPLPASCTTTVTSPPSIT